ncbi:DUF6600 domain-containing protein [Gaoshiqia sp. Z1-71]|uniref:DUF6600 domain-containing protein n=1 Tax=Gaoshiqia hydrogeniformans TaxID=3290090 RepID=UPI003BF82421
MKTNIKLFGLLFILVTATVICPKQLSAQLGSVSLQVFYDELSPYGQWVEYPNYGYVWIPDAESDFMPYSTRGQWIYTDYGWTWVSQYEWGWAPFHYGRWDYDAYYGWLWIPDYEWGPSWVTWRRSNGYYGWQPMRPGISISFSFGNDYYNNYRDHWMFVRERDFQRSNISRYHISGTNRDRIIRNSTVINNTYVDNSRNTTYISGPGREDVQRSTGRNVSKVAIQENNRPGQDLRNGQLRIYRPQVKNTNDQGRKPTPGKITNIEDMKRSPERSKTIQQRKVSPAVSHRENMPNNAKQQNNKGIEPPARQRMNENSPDNKREQQQNRAIPRNNDDNKAKPVVVDPKNNRMKTLPSKPNVQQTENEKQKLQQKTETQQNTKRDKKQSKKSNKAR